MADEQWLPVPEFPGYDVSDLGRVRSWRRQGAAKTLRTAPVLKNGRPDKDGYLHVALFRNGSGHHRSIHRLVLEVFVGPCPSGHEARHVRNNSPSDNRLSNLEWSTHLVNIRDKWTHGTMPTGATHHAKRHPERVPRGENAGSSRLTERQVREILRSTETQVALAARFGVHQTAISLIRTGKNWRHVYNEVHSNV